MCSSDLSWIVPYAVVILSNCRISPFASRVGLRLLSSGFFYVKIAVAHKLGHSQAIIQDASEFNVLLGLGLSLACICNVFT